MVWPHDKEELEMFQKYFNSIYPDIKFTMKTEQGYSPPPSLSVLLKIKSSG
jgi:hypothetical protein